MKKLIILLLFIPLVSYGQIQVQGAKPTYENPYPQPIKIQVQQNPNNDPISNAIRNVGQNTANNIARAAANRRAAEANRRADEANRRAAEAERSGVVKNNNEKENAFKELKNLKELLDMDLITQDEFDKKASGLKRIILDDGGSNSKVKNDYEDSHRGIEVELDLSAYYHKGNAKKNSGDIRGACADFEKAIYDEFENFNDLNIPAKEYVKLLRWWRKKCL